MPRNFLAVLKQDCCVSMNETRVGVSEMRVWADSPLIVAHTHSFVDVWSACVCFKWRTCAFCFLWRTYVLFSCARMFFKLFIRVRIFCLLHVRILVSACMYTVVICPVCALLSGAFEVDFLCAYVHVHSWPLLSTAPSRSGVVVVFGAAVVVVFIVEKKLSSCKKKGSTF